MTISQKQLEANRRNAKLGGPKTKEGKEIARYNALKHGLLAKAVIITTGPDAEAPRQFDDLLNSLQNQLAPQGTLEQILVEKMAVACWRLRRACRHEADLYIDEKSPLSSLKAKFAKKESPINKSQLDRLLKYEGAIERQFYRAMHQLERLQRLRAGHMIPAPIALDIDLFAD